MDPALILAVSVFVAVIGWCSFGAAVALDPLLFARHLADPPARQQYARWCWAVALVCLAIVFGLLGVVLW